MQSFKIPWMQILVAGALVFIGLTMLRAFKFEVNALTGIAVIIVASVLAAKAAPKPR